jgi:RimJ/RimL family protein N-acetyltransferase
MNDIKLPIKTKRLILTDFVMDDVADVVKIGERLTEQAKNNPDYRLFYWFRPDAGETPEQNIRKRISASIADSLPPPRVNYFLAMRLAENNRLIGRFAIAMDGTGDFGFFIDPPYQRRGYLSEAAIAMLDLYFERFSVLTSTADPGNKPSHAIQLLFGAEVSGKIDKSVRDGEKRNVYTITRENYERARAEKLG